MNKYILLALVAGAAMGCSGGPNGSQHAALTSLDTRAVEIMHLDPKTSIPYEDRDRTDAMFFHGFRVLQSGRASVELGRQVQEAMRDAESGVWRPDITRDADYGVRITDGSAVKDYLVCLQCKPSTISRPLLADEATLSESGAASIDFAITKTLKPNAQTSH